MTTLNPQDLFRLRLQGRPEGQLLYQFTDANGVLGMLRDRCLHATHFRYVNDRREGDLGFALIQSAVDSLAAAPRHEGDERVLESVKGILKQHLEPVEYFISCFSEKYDHHGQWAEYGDHGKGFSVAFSALDLATFTEPNSELPKITLLKVTYLQDVHERLFSDLVSLGGDEYDRQSKLQPQAYADAQAKTRLAQSAASIILDLSRPACISVKDWRYRDEAGWRLVCQIHRYSEVPIHFRAGRYGLTPYMKLQKSDASPLPIKELHPGPMQDPVAARHTLALLKKSSQLQRGADVNASGLSFRGAS